MSTGRLEGKVALITGAARGQGEAEARLLAAEGARVVLADVLDDDGGRVAEELGEAAAYEHLDVTRPADWERVVAAAVGRFGRLDILVNNAGILRVAPIADSSLDDYLGVINVNQVGCWLGMRAVIPALREAGGGAIVNTSSIAGLEGVAGMSAYVSSKFAVRGMTKVAALELGPLGIRVNAMAPGTVYTEQVQAVVSAEAFAAIGAGYPLGRNCTPDDLGRLAVFLASHLAESVTGQIVAADNGAGLGRAPSGARPTAAAEPTGGST